MKKIFIFLALFISVNAYSNGMKDLSNQQKKQEKLIKTAHKNGKVSDREYAKLMDEQRIIKRTIELAEMDKVITSAELNKVHSKLERAEKRLVRYKNNSEVY